MIVCDKCKDVNKEAHACFITLLKQESLSERENMPRSNRPMRRMHNNVNRSNMDVRQKNQRTRFSRFFYVKTWVLRANKTRKEE